MGPSMSVGLGIARAETRRVHCPSTHIVPSSLPTTVEEPTKERKRVDVGDATVLKPSSKPPIPR